MITYVALLRGINVAGQKKVPMAELRALMNELSFKNVQTYIQSGNVVFQTSEQSSAVIERKISEAIQNTFHFEVPVLVKTYSELQTIFEVNPLDKAQFESTYFTLLHHMPSEDAIETASKEQFVNESFKITATCVYVFPGNGYGKAKCNNNFFERKLKVSATTRNFKTMQKLLSLCSDL
ncbi:DUF1697 domain-containing protein [Formosa algae]|uniref:Uncharacterized protein (DUF1697 family) n=1 Tax=Formosa algae TaxID=225843 RepID=A0A9X1CBI2_9FLAO|nr:DUF1697 domain-containing protein [Formosa algae]MBP1839240.1 uncharacterized protein (DUF1697 family) [Formosa algae]MDQ0334017.1 uncharacterized protein (DUF1697 family) [Formosa algae]OEI79345.1 hypothetical protein AST99_14100 [Formosa algae]